jgi:hypothetical protein
MLFSISELAINFIETSIRNNREGEDLELCGIPVLTPSFYLICTVTRAEDIWHNKINEGITNTFPMMKL